MLETRQCGSILAAQARLDTGAPVILTAGGDGAIVWTAAAGDNPRNVLAHCAMIHLGRAFAENPGLATRWRELIDDKHGTCLVIDGTTGTVEVLGNGPQTIAVEGQRIILDPGASIGFDPGQRLAIVNADGREFPCWPADAA